MCQAEKTQMKYKLKTWFWLPGIVAVESGRKKCLKWQKKVFYRSAERHDTRDIFYPVSAVAARENERNIAWNIDEVPVILQFLAKCSWTKILRLVR